LETNFYENAKPTTFQQERLLFRFEIIKILCSKYEGFSLRSASYLDLTRTAKTYAKQTSFQATDATTQFLNQEENDIFFFFILFYCKIMQQGKMMTRSKPREIKENFGLKHRSQPESEHKMRKKQSR
jgi:hypothetical protein